MRAALFLIAFLSIAPASAQTAMTGEGTPIVTTASAADYRRVVERTVRDYVVPAYGRLHDMAGTLHSALIDLCAAPDDERRGAVALAFTETIAAWSAVDFLRFGPMAQEGRYERFAFFPDVHGTGARQLRRFLATEDETLLDPGALAKQSAAVQGLPALESLLFSGSKALLHAEVPEPYRCTLAGSIAGNMERIAAEAVEAWDGEGGWAALIEDPGPENPVYRSHSEAMTEVLKAILTGLEQMREHRLLPALGGTPEQAKASRAPYNISGQAIPYLQASAASLRRFVDSSGILGLLPPTQSGYGNSVAFEFGNLDRALEETSPDLEAALADPALRGKLVYAGIVLKSLRDLFERRIAVWTGLVVGFNSLDGD